MVNSQTWKIKKFLIRGLVLFFGCIIAASPCFAFPPQEKVYDGLLVKAGTSTLNIMPLLANIAGRQQVHFKRKGYFTELYGQHRGNYILIEIRSAGKIKDLHELKSISKQITHNVTTAYPSSKGRIEFKRASSDFWDTMIISFDNGKIIDQKIKPNAQIMQERIKISNLTPPYVDNKLTFDLISGSFNGTQVGISMTPEKVIHLMGKQPEDTGLDIYSYYTDGLEFSFLQKSDSLYCYAITIFLQKCEGMGVNYKPFKSNVLLINKDDDQEKIIEKFKGQKDFTIENMSDNSLIFKTFYGHLTFFFDTKNGIVDTIVISKY